MSNSAVLALREGATTKKTPTKKKAKKKTAAAAKPDGVARKRQPKMAIPSLDELRLAPDGIQGSKSNKYINITFANGYIVRLLPVNLPKAECLQVRDLMVDWMNKRIGG